MEASKPVIGKPFGHMPPSGVISKHESNSGDLNKHEQTPDDQNSILWNYHLVIALLGGCGVAAWIIMFSLGMLIDSTLYRASLGINFRVDSFLITVLTFTPTNIAILCLVSSFTGGCASLLVISKAQKVLGWDKQDKKTDSHIYMSENPFTSMLRGALVFFAFLAGVFVTGSTALTSPTAAAYTQAAGVVSMLAFIVGYDPTLFKSLISIGDKIKGGSS